MLVIFFYLSKLTQLRDHYNDLFIFIFFLYFFHFGFVFAILKSVFMINYISFMCSQIGLSSCFRENDTGENKHNFLKRE